MKNSVGRKNTGLVSGAGSGCRGLLFVLLILCSVSLTLTSCSGAGGQVQESPEPVQTPDTGFVVKGPDSFDSADTAIVMEKNTGENRITLLNLNVGRNYTLSYDGTTRFHDRYGESIALSQVNCGDIVDVTFLKSEKHLTTLQISPKTWNYEKVTFFEIDTVRGEATVGQEAQKLKITANTRYFSDGHTVDVADLNPVDVLSFQGIDTEVLTVNIERGHGYLRLSGQEHFTGGWIEIGQSQVHRITEDMLIPVAEGTYPVLVSRDGNRGEKTVVIHRNEETVMDISDIHVEEPEVGTMLFSLTPASAELYVDGEKVDASLPVNLVYGIHQLIVRAGGYQTLTQYVRVGQPSAGLDIKLDAVESGDSVEKESAGEDTVTDYYKVYIDAPKEVEVYLDGAYVGISPCSFRKEEGSHVITLRRAGYTPRSYTLQISGEDKDISYSFADLESSVTVSPTPMPTGLDDIVSDVLGTLFN